METDRCAGGAMENSIIPSKLKWQAILADKRFLDEFK